MDATDLLAALKERKYIEPEFMYELTVDSMNRPTLPTVLAIVPQAAKNLIIG